MEPGLHSRLHPQLATESSCCKVQQYVSWGPYISYVPNSTTAKRIICVTHTGVERKKEQVHIQREHLLSELNDGTTVFPFHPISAVLLLGPLVWTLICTLLGSKATD